jgi:hypothetical protein
VGRGAANECEQFEHPGAGADHAFKAMGADEFRFKARGVEAFLEVVEEAADTGAEGGDLDGFREVVAGAEADSFDGGFRV